MKPNLTHFSLIQLFNMLEGFDAETEVKVHDYSTGDVIACDGIYEIPYEMSVRDVENVLLTDVTTLSTGRVWIRKLRVVLR